MIKIICRLRAAKSATLFPVFLPVWAENAADGGRRMLLLACSLPEAANAAGKMPLCADFGCGGLFAAGRGKCGMGIMKRPLRRFAAAFFIVFTVPSGRGGPRR
jgi:hypothetical protein